MTEGPTAYGPPAPPLARADYAWADMVPMVVRRASEVAKGGAA